MKYTADFAMAGALSGGLKTGVLNRVTGQLGGIANKAKNWLQNTQKIKPQVVGSAGSALGTDAIAARKAAEQLAARNKTLQDGIAAKSRSVQEGLRDKARLTKDSQTLASSAALRSDLTAGSARQINRGSADRFSKAGAVATLNDNRSLRLRYTKDPRTGKLIAAAYNASISLLCDI